MPLQVELLRDWVGLRLRCSGDLTAQEFIARKNRLLFSSRNWRRLKFVVVDGSSVDSAVISADEVQILADLDTHNGLLLPTELRIALVFPNNAAFGLARMWEVWAEPIGWQTRVFRSLSDASQWLDLDSDEREWLLRGDGLLLQ